MSVEVQNLSFAYGERPVLQNLTFTAGDGELLSVLGPNGVGKSTLFRCILGLLKGFTGSVTVGGQDVAKLSAGALARTVAYIPQSHYPAFNYTVLNMVLMGTTSHVSPLSGPGKAQTEQAMAALEQAGIAHLAEKGYTQISGGERQLTLLARALVQNAKVLVLDEPTANLDYGNQLRVMERVRSLASGGYTVIQSTHNPEQAFLFSHHILALLDGKTLADGTAKDVVTQDLMRRLYGVDTRVCSLFDDRVRVCVPSFVAGEEP